MATDRQTLELIISSIEDLKKTNSNTLKNYLYVTIFILTVFGGAIGWNVLERTHNSKQLDQMSYDIGIMLIYMPKAQQEEIPMYEDLLKKYFPNIKRGSSTFLDNFNKKIEKTKDTYIQKVAL